MSRTVKRRLEIIIVAIVLATLALTLLPALQMEYTPTSEQVMSHPHLAPFLVREKSIEGIYGNYDIDAIVFRYATSSSDAAEFEAQLANQAEAAGWSPLHSRKHRWRFERITPKSNNIFCGAEEVRIRLRPDSMRVDVGWVQGDSLEDVESFSETHEAKWAHSNVWQRMETAP